MGCHSTLQWTHPTPSTTAVHGGCRVRRRSRVTQPPDASPHGKAPPGRPVWVPGWLPWAGLSTWRPCAARAAVGARTPDQPTHRGRRGYMSAQGVSPGRSTVSIASKRDGSGQPVALASSDRQGLSRGRHPLRRHAMVCGPCKDVGVCGEEVSEYDDWQRRQPLPAWQTIELGTADDPAAAALDVQRCSVTPAVLPGWRADCAPLPDLCATLLYNAAVPCWRTFARRTHTHVVSASGATRLSCERGIAAQSLPQNSIARFI